MSKTKRVVWGGNGAGYSAGPGGDAGSGGKLRAQTQEPPNRRQEGDRRQRQASAEVIRTESRLVLVDTVVTDKKGHYVTDLTQGDFKVLEDNKEQTITSFCIGSDPAVQTAAQRHYMILFFDNSTMEIGDQMAARNTATKFVDGNAGSDQLMAIVNFTGSLQIHQNFTANTTLLKAAVSGTK